MKLVACMVCLAAALAAADAPKIVFIRSFPKSQPAYIEITVDRNGHGVYKEAPDDQNPLTFNLTPAEAGEVFALAAKLDHFAKPIESGLKVAFMGDKTFRWENGAERHEVKFNYSTIPEAQQIWDWFERMAETERQFIGLENAAQFEKLGVNDAVLHLQAAMERDRIVAAAQFLPLLDRIVKSESYLHMARERAAALADAIRNPAPTSQANQPATSGSKQ
jgi:hypothetical protein